jgi:hypothetical protein
MTTANDTIGKLLQGEQERDAIHIAVAPVVAGHGLSAGTHIRFNNEGLAVGTNSDAIGIVDPFLVHPVHAGERFWMFLYPNTITSLRHDWAHPAFGNVPQSDPLKQESEKYLQDFADRLFSYYGKPDYEREWGTPFELLLQCAESGFPTDIEYGQDCEPTAEFWMHFERYTGRKVTHKPVHFRCAC